MALGSGGGQMQDRLLAVAARLSDADLLRRVFVLAGREREATVELVAHLAELDARRLYLGEGFGSLFSYCTGALRLAEHAAYNRIEAARASRRLPAILDRLADGCLNLSTVRLLAPHLRPDNFESVVSMAKGKSKREVEALVARLAPRPDVAASVRKVPAPAKSAAVQPPTDPEAAPLEVLTAGAAATAQGALTAPASTPAAALDSAPARAASAPGRPAQRAVVTPLAPERYRVQFTVGEATHEKLRRVQDLLRREIPDGDPGAIFDRALTLLLEDVARKKVALSAQPRKGRAATRSRRSRYIPACVKRAVWLRDGGRCAFVASGRRCTERAFLEFHHREPYALGGEATAANISLRCRQHNVYEGELAFGARVPAVGGAPAGHPGQWVRSPAVFRAEAISPNSPRGELDTS